MRVGAITHPCGVAHEAWPGHPERPDRLRSILDHLARVGLWEGLEHREPAPAERETLELVHDPGHLDVLERLDGQGGGRLDRDTGMGPVSLEAAQRGSQAAVDAAALVLDGTWDAGIALMRPPGHHATRDRPMGFCLTNHVAVAARWAIRSGGASRVLILDWDAHHGNGTQDIFWQDGDVLYVSLHQYPWYPGTGDVTETGEGAGGGTTMNVALPAGTGEDTYRRALEDLVLPEAERFSPDLVCVSAGYDAHERDPLCMMRLRAGAFFRFTRMIGALGRGPVVVLEGGYDLDALRWSAAATVSALIGESAPVGVPDEELEVTIGSADADRWVERAATVRAELG